MFLLLHSLLAQKLYESYVEPCFEDPLSGVIAELFLENETSK